MKANTNSTDADVFGVFNPDGTATLGGRPGKGVMYENTTRDAQGLPPEALRHSAPVSLPEQPAETRLPFAHVARALAGHEVTRLRATVAAIERELDRGVIGANGSPVPYLIDKHRQLVKDLEAIRGEIEALEGMTDHEARNWAAGRGIGG